jgi:hypothetical protein
LLAIWTRNLLAEGIEANPGPQFTVDNFVNALKSEMGIGWSAHILPIVDEFLNSCTVSGELSFERALQILNAPNEGPIKYFIEYFKVA